MKYQLLPPLSVDERNALEESIAEHGVLVPVEYDEAGDIIDGHHRVAICEKLGLVDWPRFVRKGLSETEKRSLSRELNFARRHLSTAQKQALIADQLRETPTISSRAIAARLGVDHKTVSAARQRLESTGEIPQLDETVGTDGKARPTRKAIRTTFMPEPENRRELVKAAKDIRAEQQQTRHQVRLAHMEMVAEKGEATTAKLTRAYPIYYADPPWKFGVRSELTGREKSAENHYPTLDTDAICDLMAELTAGDHAAVLALWTTNPMLLDALRVMERCGFVYVHHWIWDKEVAGTGYWGRDRHELLLIGRRGDVVAPLPGTQPETVHRERKGRHSAKPDFFADTIERLYPGIAKVEIFARAARPGWDVWGFEAGGEQGEASEAPVALSKAEKAGELPEAADPRYRAGDNDDPDSAATSSRPLDMAGAEPPPSAPAAASPNLPPAPSVSAPVEFHVGGMKKGSFARFAIHRTAEDTFAISAAYELAGLCGGRSPATGSIATYGEALRLALDELQQHIGRLAEDRSSTCKDHHRAACRAGLRWIEARRAEWGLA